MMHPDAVSTEVQRYILQHNTEIGPDPNMEIKEDTHLNCTNCYVRNVCPGSIVPKPASECDRYVKDPNYVNGRFQLDPDVEKQKEIAEKVVDILGEKYGLDQTAKADVGKPRLTLVPRKIIFAIAKIREYGNAKYPEGGPDNYKHVEVERYKDALFRHLVAYLDDPHGIDEESKLPHLWHLACNVAFLCELEDEEIKKGMEEKK